MSNPIVSHLQALHLAGKDEVRRLTPHQPYNVRVDHVNALAKYRKAKDTSEEPVIPAPGLFKSLATLAKRSENALPTIGEGAVHLELLEALYTLRTRIINSTELDTTFGVKINNRTVYRKRYNSRQRRNVMEPVKLKDQTWGARRRKKWSYFLTIAVGRFRTWVTKMNEAVPSGRQSVKTSADGSDASQEITLPHLPPLDVLMVWHAFLLNPKDFKNYCDKQGLRRIRRLPFPWSQIHGAINARDWSYSLSRGSEEWLRNVAKIEPDLFEYLAEVGKTTNPISSALSRYGGQGATVFSLGQLFRTEGLTTREYAFLDSLQQAEAQKSTKKPLVDNVQRQASFVDKMHAHLWIRSPAVEGSLRRAIDRYEKFLQLFKLYPGKILVPTLDIDLAWHTHQCSALQYEASTQERTGRLINHDDKIGQRALHHGMEETKQLFLIRFGQEYSVCLCWDCEAVASALEVSDEDGTLDVIDISVLVKQVHSDVEYYRVVELARRDGQLALPVRH